MDLPIGQSSLRIVICNQLPLAEGWIRLQLIPSLHLCPISPVNHEANMPGTRTYQFHKTIGAALCRYVAQTMLLGGPDDGSPVYRSSLCRRGLQAAGGTWKSAF